jgi:Ni/Co efflux regulator RcnB
MMVNLNGPERHATGCDHLALLTTIAGDTCPPDRTSTPILAPHTDGEVDMRTLILSAVALASLVSPLAVSAAEAAPARDREVTTVRHGPNRTVVTQRNVYRNDHRANVRQWHRGERFDRRQARNYRPVANYRAYNRLYAPPRGYQWVQSGNDAVLVALASGLIGAVIGGAF